MKPGSEKSPRVFAIIVNYNGWQHSIECVSSLLNLSHSNCQVVVCDNHSNDRSFEKILNFVRTRFPEPLPVAKWFLNDPSQASRIECFESYGPGQSRRSCAVSGPGVMAIRTTANLGFAGGNNVGIRYALSAGDADYVWLLNPDTVVRPPALSAMVARMQAVPEAGICGSTILYYDDPRKIQSLGGARYLKWAGVGVQLGAGRRWPMNVPAEPIEKELSYVSGASMLVSRPFLETIGLMEEGYFLYFEEIDWARRAEGRFKLAYAPDSIVYHKEGSAIGSSRSGRRRSPQSFFWLTRSRLQFTTKYYPEAVPSVILYSLINCMQWALLNRNPSILLAGVKACGGAGRGAIRDRRTR
jgi:GT2 family glycosyltransferase